MKNTKRKCCNCTTTNTTLNREKQSGRSSICVYFDGGKSEEKTSKS